MSSHRVTYNIILWSVLWFGAVWAQQEPLSTKDLTQYSHEIWQTEDGLPQNSISCITQAHDGYLWLGTLEGLVRFDGVRFTVFDAGNTGAILSNRIVSLFEDRLGNLWVGTEGGGVTCLSYGKFKTYTTEDGLLSNTIGQMCEDSEGRIWIAHGQGVSIYHKGDILAIKRQDSIPKNSIAPQEVRFSRGAVSLEIKNFTGIPWKLIGPMCSDKEGNIWIGSDTGLIQFDGSSFRVYTEEDGIKNTNFFALYPGKNGEIWMGTARGLGSVQNGTVKWRTAKEGLSTDFVWSLCERRDGSLLIGTQGGGINRLYRGEMSTFSTQNGLSSDLIWSLFEDREGIIWIGTNGGGLNRLKDALFTTYTTLQGLVYDFVWSITQSPDGDIWFGTYQGLSRLSKGKFYNYTTRDGLLSDFVWSVYADRSGQVWIGTASGLNKYSDGKIVSYPVKKGNTETAIRSIYQDSEGTLWVGSVGGLSRLPSSGADTFIPLPGNLGLSSTAVMSLCGSRDGSLWIGTGNGLRRYKDGVITLYTVMEGLSNDIIRSIYEDREGNLWIGTQGGGLNLYRNGKFDTISQRHGLFNNVVSQILEDDDGDFWMSCNKGIFRVKRQELLDFADGKVQEVHSYPYGKDDGMKSPECNGSSQPAGWKTADGNLWFPTIKGVVVVNPHQEEIANLTPPVIIEKVLINKEFYNSLIEGKVPVESGDLEVEYTGLSFYAPEKVQFKYKLAGYDKYWNFVGDRRTAYYTNLPPGTYTFWVSTTGKDTVGQTMAASFTFTLLPHFYQESWFFVVCGLLVLSIGYGGYRIRMQQAERREKRLVKVVKERTQNLQVEKENAERARVEAERLQRLAEEANKVKSEILHIAAHDMKSPLISIKMYSQIIGVESGAKTQIGQFADDIFYNSQRMLDLINELLDASAIENGKINLLKTRVNISRLAESVVQGNKRVAERKEQSILLEAQEECFIEADESRIRQVADNLISNAIKYSSQGRQIWVKVHSSGENIRFEVKDEGPGLSQDDLTKVFGKFQRLTPRPTGGEPSTGLGLSVVKHLVEIQNGKVWVESEEGQGCNFIVEFKSVVMSGIHPKK